MAKRSPSRSHEDDAINEILIYFDFEKVHKIMTVLDWRWFENGSNGHIPTIEELKMTAVQLLEEVNKAKEPSSLRATGGFWAEKLDDQLTLRFDLEHWTTDIDEK